MPSSLAERRHKATTDWHSILIYMHSTQN